MLLTPVMQPATICSNRYTTKRVMNTAPITSNVAGVAVASKGIGPATRTGLAAASHKAEDKRMRFKPSDMFPAKTLESVTGEPILANLSHSSASVGLGAC